MSKGIKIKAESVPWSEVQAVLARGDNSLAPVLADTDRVSLPAWRKAVEKQRLDVDFYAHRRWEVGQKLPWALLESDAMSEKLESELGRAIDKSVTLWHNL